MGRRTLLLIAAILIAALGTSLIYLYVQGADQRALGTQATQTVYVTTGKVVAGTQASEVFSPSNSEQRTVPISISQDAVTSATQVKGKTLAVDLDKGAMLTIGAFTAEAQTALTIPKGFAAVSITLGDPQRVAGFVTPGSSVAIFVTGSRAGGDAQGGKGASQTNLLLNAVQVIATGSTTNQPTQARAGQTAQNVAQTIITLALTPDDIQTLIEAQTDGQLYFALLNPKESPQPKARQATSKDVFKG